MASPAHTEIENGSASAGYPVVWREDDATDCSGKLTLERDGLRLSGTTRRGFLSAKWVSYDDLAGVAIGRRPEERLGGRPTVLLERPGRPPLRIAAIGPGLLSELADLLVTLIAARPQVDRLAVVVPLRRGALERARALVEQGPPFDTNVSGFERHRVFLSEREAVFVFEGPDVRTGVERLVHDPTLWRATLPWSGVIAGRPRLAEIVYAWPDADLSLT